MHNSCLAPRVPRWLLIAAFAGLALGTAPQVHAKSPIPDLSLPPLSRMTAERTATATPPVIGRFEPAPTPNQNVLAPRGEVVTGPILEPSMFLQKATYRGDGYTLGSSQQVTQEPRRMPLPGINLKVPLN